MCARCDEVEELLALSELEEEVILAEADDGFNVPTASRPLTDAERRAGTRFRDIADLHDSAEAEALEILGDLERVLEAEISGAIFGPGETAVSGPTILRALAALNANQPKPVQTAVATAAARLAAVYERAHATSAAIVLDEATRQGSKAAPLAEIPKPAPGAFTAVAAAAAMYPWTRTTGKLQSVLGSPGALAAGPVSKADLRATLSKIPLDGALDTARQGINQAVGTARADVGATLEPSEIWASELLDSATCGPCAAIDGKEYETLAAAREDYPHGGYAMCDGDARCRGTLVFIFPAGQETPPPPPNRTPPPDPKPSPPVAPVAPEEPAVPRPPAPTAAPPKRRKGQVQRYDSLDQLPVKGPEAVPDEWRADALACNPGYDKTGRTRVYNYNCTNVISAYELRRRGYDVNAAAVPGGKGRYDRDYLPMWTDPETGRPPVYRKAADPDALRENIMREPVGARGTVKMVWKSGGGHVFNYERTPDGVRFIEAQDASVDAAGHLPSAKLGSLAHFRMDTLAPTSLLVRETVETRPPELLADLAAKKLLETQKRQAEWVTVWSNSGFSYQPPRYRLVSKDKYEPIPEAERARMLEEKLAAEAARPKPVWG
ncbi:MuF-like minor capsid protein [Arthrobacter phage Prairie]|uniref:MuF-like minor capsid protein n=1 Tax=Arthrobacter phage Prairie TaxID=2816463 RepID=A0A8A5LLF6_9CAUD|nr:MuF-like minor capsid protein [Arthrobacter phage Prairie]